ncbi:MAG: DUF3791 domain-containing protein [Treponema sp.]|nr:DUF3791 domain-containing protein [Treponema sp.]
MSLSSNTERHQPFHGSLLLYDFRIIDYIKSCYDALHVMGGLAITAGINNLINGIHRRKYEKE